MVVRNSTRTIQCLVLRTVVLSSGVWPTVSVKVSGAGRWPKPKPTSNKAAQSHPRKDSTCKDSNQSSTSVSAGTTNANANSNSNSTDGNTNATHGSSRGGNSGGNSTDGNSGSNLPPSVSYLRCDIAAASPATAAAAARTADDIGTATATAVRSLRVLLRVLSVCLVYAKYTVAIYYCRMLFV